MSSTTITMNTTTISTTTTRKGSKRANKFSGLVNENWDTDSKQMPTDYKTTAAVEVSTSTENIAVEIPVKKPVKVWNTVMKKPVVNILTARQEEMTPERKPESKIPDAPKKAPVESKGVPVHAKRLNFNMEDVLNTPEFKSKNQIPDAPKKNSTDGFSEVHQKSAKRLEFDEEEEQPEIVPNKFFRPEKTPEQKLAASLKHMALMKAQEKLIQECIKSFSKKDLDIANSEMDPNLLNPRPFVKRMDVSDSIMIPNEDGGFYEFSRSRFFQNIKFIWEARKSFEPLIPNGWINFRLSDDGKMVFIRITKRF